MSNLSELVQFYAPFAGIIVITFMMGILWQRVKALENASRSDQADRDRLIRLEERSTANGVSLEQIKAQIEGLHRQMNELVRSRIHGTIAEIERA